MQPNATVPDNAVLHLQLLTQFCNSRGIVRTGFKKVCITAAFPVTIKTAIVSPIARPIPKIAPAVIPDAE
jgi:hypothetical protein